MYYLNNMTAEFINYTDFADGQRGWRNKTTVPGRKVRLGYGEVSHEYPQAYEDLDGLIIAEIDLIAGNRGFPNNTTEYKTISGALPTITRESVPGHPNEQYIFIDFDAKNGPANGRIYFRDPPSHTVEVNYTPKRE